MHEVHSKLYIGNENDCFYEERPEFAVLHACKSPCHQEAVGYTGNLSSSHPAYLIHEAGSHLFLNMIDPDRPLFSEVLFTKSVEFIASNIITGNVLIHCNQGFSRAPSLALVYLASIGVIEKSNYAQAAAAFLQLYPNYQPGMGIQIFLKDRWNQILK